MEKNYPITLEQIYEATNRGLDIFTKYLNLPNGAENGKVMFKYRESEKSKSAHLSIKENIYFLVDFGGKNFSPVSMVCDFFGLEFGDAVKKITSDFSLIPNQTFYKPEKSFKENTKLPLSHFKVNFKKFQNLNFIGRFVHEMTNLKQYNFEEVESYERVVLKKETQKPMLVTVTATAEYPIFAYTPNAKVWVKLYEPRATKNEKGFSSKHSYLGEKPKRFVHGLKRLIDSVEIEIINGYRKDIRDSKSIKEKADLNDLLQNYLIDEVYICSGGSDGLNVASLGKDVIWFNSESEQISHDEYAQLKNICKEIYNIPDIDKSGVKYGNEVAENFWELKTILLSKDKMNKNGKDFRDWLDYYKTSDKKNIITFFDNMKNSALKCKFFERRGNSYKINLSNLHYFLNVKNYFTYQIEHKHVDIATDDQIIFVQINGNIVNKVSPRDIRKFCENYLKNKGQKLEVLNLVKSSPYFNDSYLFSMDSIKLDFKSYTPDSQFFFFQNQVAKISELGIELKKHGDVENFTWNKSVLKHDIKKENPFFEHYLDNLGRNRVRILREDCEYKNYLINGSRTFWRKELEEPFDNEILKKEYHEANRFNLNGKNLTEEEQIIQEQHFLNKCYAFGYMMHKFKREDFAKMLYIMDDTPKDSDDDANGRTGKSMGLRGLRVMLPNRFLIDGKNKSITTDKHIFDGLDENSGFIEIEDADKHLDIKFFYTKITVGVVVNPKQRKPFALEFEDVAKMALTTNYGLANITGSDIGRLLFVSMSDYYHEKTENYNERRKISDDFNGKSFFQTWSKEEFNLFYNFQMQCCLFYLQNVSNEFQAPQDNITISNLKAGIGDTFFDWADEFLYEDNLNNLITREEVFHNYQSKGGKKLAKSFKNSLKDYCKIKKWILDPEDQKNKNGRIMLNVFCEKKKKNVIKECFFIQTEDFVKAERVIESNIPF